MNRILSHTVRAFLRVAIALTTFVSLSANSTIAEADGTRGTLRLQVKGAKHDRGKFVARLFRRSDQAPRGKAYREISTKPIKGKASLEFDNLAYGTYALFVFHDENGNGIPDHNFLGFPTEPMGFSGDFRLSLFSGVPDFDDLRFPFRKGAERIAVEVR